MFDSIHEECGVFGIYEPKTTTIANSVYFGLYALQHRGQESCGIAVNDQGVIKTHTDVGLVPDVFNKERLEQLGPGNMAVGHVRYSTTGSSGPPTPSRCTSATSKAPWCWPTTAI